MSRLLALAEDDSWKDSPRGMEAKEKEKAQRHFVRLVLERLAPYHQDLRYRFTPDRKKEVDVHIDTRKRTTRTELKANDSHFTYFHGDPDKNTWSYEYNFIVREAGLIIGTQYTELPEDNIIPVVRTLPPTRLSELLETASSKLQTVITFTALKLERELFPLEEWTLRASIEGSSMATINSTIASSAISALNRLEAVGLAPIPRGPLPTFPDLEARSSLSQEKVVAVAIEDGFGRLA